VLWGHVCVYQNARTTHRSEIITCGVGGNKACSDSESEPTDFTSFSFGLKIHKNIHKSDHPVFSSHLRSCC
jgi:hypothetical protein